MSSISLILKLDDFSKQIKLLESENQRFQGKLDSINLARKLSDDIFIKATSLGSGKIDTNYKPGLGRESFEIEQAKQETRTNSENSESTLTDPSTSVNEENSDDETVINCNPDDTDFTVLCAGEPKDDTWYIDSGRSKHMTTNHSLLQDFKPTLPPMQKLHNQTKMMRIQSRGNHQNQNPPKTPQSTCPNDPNASFMGEPPKPNSSLKQSQSTYPK
ncbi:hypothetical protein L2E82_28179 [Cichorium intybus]|uniref:Uncharacterized protein n=1 Tax=Cichorium intybus TaxID=13427 RepID=A0ACB9CV18_CICIN|nr:hypothetical protein L2E82_28179 [Cichorium intybus]